VYSSDHGYKQGQWRVGTSKQHPYETDIHVPLLFTGPGIPAGTILQHMSGNVDIMPTVLDLAGGPGAVPPFVDGKSLVSLLVPSVAAKRAAGALERGVAETQPWRDAFLVEYKSVGTYYNDHSNCAGKPSCAIDTGTGKARPMPRSPYAAVNASDCKESNVTGGGNCWFVDSIHSNNWRNLRVNNADLGNLAYIEYDPAFLWNVTDAKGSGLQHYELYNITIDPYQIDNIYDDVDDAFKTKLHAKLATYYACHGTWTTPSTCP